ncbi:MAG: hypothetical protein Q9209_001496 [Squamulea sp. 1 TL-2023]
MLSSEDNNSESSSPSLQPTQARDIDEVERTRDMPGSSSDGSIDDTLDDNAFDSSPYGVESQEQEQAKKLRNRSSHPKDVTISLKRASSTRSNKYHGPPSTWRDWTAAERQIATSLDQIRARDLSLHLYNFYCLKRRVDSTREWQVETDPDTDDYVSTSRKRKTWLPVRTWTAWPMDPRTVPRESDESKREVTEHDHVNVKTTAYFPSELLSDLLVARACKKAKERFQEREWEDSDVAVSDPPSDKDSRNQRRVAELAGESSVLKYYEPVVMADDERAKSILQPSINHVLHKLDTLLMGLHHARSSYATFKKTSTDSRPVTDDENPGSRKRKRTASRTKASRPSPRHRSAVSSREASEAAAESATSGVRHKAGLGLRDWSDVLGVASLTGFPSEVVAKTAARCSNLFDEGMIFRTLHEGKKGYREVKYLPDMIPVEDFQNFLQPGMGESSSQEDSEDEKVGAVHVDGFMQPIEKRKAWSRRSRSKKHKQ